MLKNLKQLQTKRAIQKTEEPTGDLIGNKIADKIKKASKISQNSLEALKSDEDIPKERYISPEIKQQISNKFRLV